MSKSIKKNYIYNLVYQVLLLLVPLATTPYISRVLGAGEVGIISYVDSVAAYFVLFATPGVAILGQREISYVQDNREKRTEVFWNIKLLEIMTALTSLFIYVIFAVQHNNLVYLIYAFNVAAILVDVSWFFQGIEEFEKIVIRNCIVKLLNVIYIFAFIKGPDDTVKYAFGLTFFVFIGNASLWTYLSKYIGWPDIKRLNPFKYIGQAIMLFIPSIAIKVYTVLDKTMLGIIGGDSYENGYYEYAMRISKIVLAVVAALSTVMIPRIGYYYKKNDIEAIDNLMYKSYKLVLLISIPLCLGLMTTAGNFVPWFLGDGYSQVIILLQILSLLIIIIGISSITGTQYMIPTRRQNMYTISVVIGAVVNFVLNIVLIEKYKSIGAAVASVIAESCVTIFQLYIVRRDINAKLIVKNGIKPLLSGLIMAVVLILEGNLLISSVINTFIMVVSGIITYTVALIVLKDSFFTSILANLSHKLKNSLIRKG